MSEKELKWLTIGGVILCVFLIIELTVKSVCNDSMTGMEKQAYSDYLKTCEIMDVVPLPPATRKEGE